VVAAVGVPAQPPPNRPGAARGMGQHTLGPLGAMPELAAFDAQDLLAMKGQLVRAQFNAAHAAMGRLHWLQLESAHEARELLTVEQRRKVNPS